MQTVERNPAEKFGRWAGWMGLGGQVQHDLFCQFGSFCNRIKRDYVCVVKYQTVLNVSL